MNKPIWVCCGDKIMAYKIKERLLDGLIADCPHDPDYKDCLKQYGDVECGGDNCRKHWEKFIEFVDLEEAEDGEQE